MKYCWMSPIIRSANSVEKMQVFCAWSSLRMSACTVPRTLVQRVRLDALVGLGVEHLVAGDAEQHQAEAVVALGQLALVAPVADAALGVDRVDLAVDLVLQALLADVRSHCWSMAAFMKNASSIGAGPLMVIETDVFGSAEVEARVELLGVVERGDRHAGVADLAVDVRAVGPGPRRRA